MLARAYSRAHSVACRSVVQKNAVDGAALPQTFDQSQFWYTNVCADALRFGNTF